MNISKEDIKIKKIVDLLDDGTFYGTLYDLYLFIGIAKGVDDIRNGRGITLEEFNKERIALYESYSRKFG